MPEIHAKDNNTSFEKVKKSHLPKFSADFDFESDNINVPDECIFTSSPVHAHYKVEKIARFPNINTNFDSEIDLSTLISE